MIKLNKIVQVKSISIEPITIAKMVFKNRDDVYNFLHLIQNCENTINHSKISRETRNLGTICRILNKYTEENNILPVTTILGDGGKEFIELLSFSSNDNEIYEYVCEDPRVVINFEFNNPFPTKEGWELQNLTICFNTFKSKEFLKLC